MCKEHLFQYKPKFNTVFNINPGIQGSPMTFIYLFVVGILGHYLSFIQYLEILNTHGLFNVGFAI
jgi:hypothetical protein